MKKLFLLLIVLLSLSTTAQDNKRLTKIDSLLTYLNNNNKFMGQLSIREGDKVIFEKAYGYADTETNLKANGQTKYKIGSISKTFTAVMIMQLIEEKKLKLETQLAKYYPQVKNAEKITIHNLLHHRTGIVDYLNADSTTVPTKNYSKEEMIGKISNYNSLFEPNSKYEYSNSNYYILGRIIEDVTKKTYAENLENRIIKKAQLQNTLLSPKVDTKNNESYSYNFLDDQWTKINEWDMSLAFGAGDIVSTSSDLTKFFHALFSGILVKKTSLDEMTKLEQSYGKGLLTLPFGERKFYGHTGGIEGFRSVIGYYPAEKLGVSLIVNGDNFNRNDIMIGVLSIYYKMPYQFPNLVSIKVKPEILNGYAGVYSSAQLPIKITIRNKNGEMEAQGTGQNAFTLNAINETTFVFDAASIKLIFKDKNMTLKQGGAEYLFTKD
ncbi:class A beta-lactamase-related serine hydrolase [Flavobacterium amnicola]|uniref:Class A beta-lactamase-related serine hydrolase n=1 Tax=Flavobacterium amnicola TaxID=2506422 RepID=A0A4Q1K4V1_9FLAO|nr:serine hydrolase domain-containing protein [Flavobacterium amnicola]RXR20597.1 class A beta-lactamase-related serine hydrolase [Flavobacterium amnicola]